MVVRGGAKPPQSLPRHPPGTVPRKRCSGQVFSITAGLGRASTPRLAAPAPVLAMDPDDGLQGHDPTLSAPFVEGGGGGPPSSSG